MDNQGNKRKSLQDLCYKNNLLLFDTSALASHAYLMGQRGKILNAADHEERKKYYQHCSDCASKLIEYLDKGFFIYITPGVFMEFLHSAGEGDGFAPEHSIKRKSNYFEKINQRLIKKISEKGGVFNFSNKSFGMYVELHDTFKSLGKKYGLSRVDFDLLLYGLILNHRFGGVSVVTNDGSICKSILKIRNTKKTFLDFQNRVGVDSYAKLFV